MTSNRQRLKKRQLELLEPRVVLSGTPTVIPINDNGSSFPRDFIQVGDVAFFVADDGESGRELWSTDGTTASIVLDINSGLASSDPTQLTEYNGLLYFVADDGVAGAELWSSDGTASGTTMVRDIFPGEGYQYGYGNGPYNSNPSNLISANGRLFFSAIDQDNGRELWMSDGTSSGTTIVRDIAPGADTNYDYTYPHSSDPADLVNVNGTIYFTADDRENGRELWKTDGTEAGTVLVRDIQTGEEPYYYYGNYYGTQPASSSPGSLTAVDGILMFTAETDNEGRELWRSDGTDAGTTLVRDITPGVVGSFDGGAYDSLVEVDGILFFAGTDDNNGRELWTSDGTSNGTTIVRNIGPGSDNGLIGQEIAVVGDEVFFSADDGSSGAELWTSDGTSSGTFLVRDLEDDIDGSYPEELTEVGGRLFFVAETSEVGVEVFESDGTSDGTFVTGDLIAGPNSSFPEELASFNNILLLSASELSEGREVWSIDSEDSQAVRSASIKIYIDGEERSVPASIGISASGELLSQVHTTGAGQIQIESIGGEAVSAVTLGDFFDTWRTNAGAAGNNANARLSSANLLGNEAVGENTVQMFVNGIAHDEFDDYVIRDGDEIALIYGENAVVSINTNFGSLLFELFEEETPQTVQNFLNYVNDGDYINSFFHRSIAGFVIQGGGFTTTSTTFTGTDQFTEIPDDAAVQNEPGISNLRGTVAMAKLGNDPNSATNQFFVNFGDNSSNLDNQNGGFTVFARVLDLSVVDTLEAIPSRDVDGGLYSDLPVTNDNQLVVIQSIEGAGFVRGERFVDENANGVMDAGEGGLGNEIVYIDSNSNGQLDSDEISTRTDANGVFKLPTLNDSVLLRYEPSSGRVLTTANDSFSVSLGIGTADGNDFGEAEPSDTTAFDDSFTVSEDGGEQRFDVLGNDVSSSDSLSISSVTQGSNGGSVSIVNDEIAYEAVAGFSGTETFSYTIQDGQGISDTATVTVTIADLSVGRLSGFAFIDRDGDGGRSAGELGVPGAEIRLSGTADSGTTVEKRVLTATDGSYMFMDVPPGTYTVTQRQPFALADGTVSTSLDGAVTSSNRISSVVVTAGQDITDSNFGEVGVKPDYVSIAWFFASSGGPESTLREMIAVGEEQNGNASLAKEIRDGTGTSPIDDGDENSSPIAVADSYVVDADDVLTVSSANGVLQNDSDPDGDQLTAAATRQPANGTLSFNSNGSFTYTPNSGFSGTDNFRYTATDTAGATSSATVTITVQGLPNTFSLSEAATTGTLVGSLTPDTDLDSPIVFEFENTDAPEALKLRPDDHMEGGEAASVVLIEYLDFQCPICARYHPIVDDLIDEFGSDLLVVRRHLPLSAIHPNAVAAATAAEAANRQGEFLAMGDLLFTNQDDWAGLSDPTPIFEQYADDLGLNLTQFRADLDDPSLLDRIDRDADIADMLGLNATPSFFLDGEQLADIPNDFDEFEALIEDQLDDFDEVFTLDRVTGEIFVANGAALDFELRSTYSLDINATDIDGDTIPLTATINLIDENESAPIANSDSYSVNEGETLITTSANGVLANDTDAEGDELTAELVSDVSNGTLSLSTDGSFTYSPDNAFVGTDSFTYEASDGDFSSASVTVTITVNDVNLSPISTGDSYQTDVDVPLNVNASEGLLANDTDPDGDVITAMVVASPQSGSLVLEDDGSFVYTPNSGFIGSDTFTYLVNDGLLDSNVSTVTVTVAGVNAAPVAMPDSYSTPQDVALTTTENDGLLANDSDADGDVIAAELITGPSNGSLTLNPNGAFVYTPDGGFFGDDSFTYIAVDGESDSAVTKVNITVTEVSANDAPVATDDVYSTPQDTTLIVDTEPGILANDTDQDGDALTVELVSSTSRGSLTLNTNGTFSYTPESGFVGSDSFTYRANDGIETSDTANVTINVTAVNTNSAPIGVDDAYTGMKNTALVVNASEGVLANDTDADGDALSLDDIITQPTDGALSFDADGSFTYTPDTDFVGTDTFVYRATDGSDASNETVVTITIEDAVDENEAPVGNDDQYETSEDFPLSVLAAGGVLANDTDSDGDDLVAQVVIPPSDGTLDLLASGSFAYTPNANFHGVDTFTYRVSDGKGGSSEAIVSINVEPINDRPIGQPDSYSVSADLLLAVNEGDGVLSNDLDVDGDTLTAELVTDVATGSLTFRENGSFDFAADANTSGSETFIYRIFDGTEFSEEISVEIEVLEMNVAPTAVSDSYILPVDSVLMVNAANGVLANDADSNSDALTVTLIAGTQSGQLDLRGDGSFTYTPDQGFHGTDTFRYTASDGEFESNPAVVAIFVNDAPVAVDDNYVGLANEVLRVTPENSILANDVDSNGDGLSINVVSTPSQGTLLVNNLDGTFDYTPAPDFVGSVTFTYQINDSFEDSNVATVTIEIVAELPLSANDDEYSIREDQVLNVDAAMGVLANDDAGDAATVELVESTANGALELSADGSFRYTPDPDFNGQDQFTYRVLVDSSSGVKTSRDVSVSLTVQNVNDAPTTEPDSFVLADQVQLIVNAANGVLRNDSDIDGDMLVASVVSDPSNGFVIMEGDGSFIYMPTFGFVGTDTFTYSASDLFTSSVETTVTIEIESTLTILARGDAYATREDQVLTVDATSGVLANDVHLGGADLTTTLITNPSNGMVVLNEDGAFEYTPDADYAGRDTFVYAATDGTSISNEVSVSIDVQAVNDAPIGAVDSYHAISGQSLTVDAAAGVLGNDVDVDDETLTALLVAEPANGQLVFEQDGSFTYIANDGFTGDDFFTYTAHDSFDQSDEISVTITVSESTGGSITVTEDNYNIREDQVLVVGTEMGVLSNDTSSLSAVLTAIIVSAPSNGTVSLLSDGSFSYTPNADFNGADSFGYTATDGTTVSDEATVSITIQAVNDRPVAVEDSYLAIAGQSLMVDVATGVLANDFDIDSNTIAALLVDGTANGQLSFEQDGSFTYLADGGFTGSDSFTYRAIDSFHESELTTVTITVSTSENQITTNADDYSIREDRELIVDAAAGVLSNDSISMGGTLVSNIVSPPENGVVNLNLDGSFEYTPDPDFAGTDTFGYSATDGNSTSAETMVVIQVQPVNDSPVGVEDSYDATVNLPLIVGAENGVLANDFDVDSTDLTAILESQPANGQLLFEADGSFTYLSNADFTGTDTFTYIASDLFEMSEPTIVSIVVAGGTTNDVQTNSDQYSIREDQSLSVPASMGVLANDVGNLSASLGVAPVNGTLSLREDGSFDYTPNPDYFGMDSFTYVAREGLDTSDETLVEITVQSVNDAPLAVSDTYTASGSTLNVTAANGVLANDTDVDGDSILALLIDDPSNGVVILNEDGSFEYTPDAGFNGEDTFTYVATDLFRDSSITTVTINVGVISQFNALNDLYFIREDQTLIVDSDAGVLLNDIKGPAGNTVSVDREPGMGSLTLNPDGSFEYTPNADFNGDDTFTYVASAGGDNASATVIVRVQPVNDAPVAEDDAYAIEVDNVLVTNPLNGVLVNDRDVDGNPIFAFLADSPAMGSLEFNSDGTFSYTPDPGFSGTVSFTYFAQDMFRSSEPATVIIQIGDAAEPFLAATPADPSSLVDRLFADDEWNAFVP